MGAHGADRLRARDDPRDALKPYPATTRGYSPPPGLVFGSRNTTGMSLNTFQWGEGDFFFCFLIHF